MKAPFTTFSKRTIDLADVRMNDICLADIAHQLACINRFNGSLKQPVSVAQHAVYVSRLLDGTGLEWQGLHHDDAEAYIGDLTKWIKDCPEMNFFRAVEDSIQRCCYKAFHVEYPINGLMHPAVQVADKLMVRFEAEHSGFLIPYNGYPPITLFEEQKVGSWTPWSWQEAEQAFTTRYYALRERGFGR